MWIYYFELLKKMAILTFVCFIMNWEAPSPSFSLGKVFGKLRLLGEFLFLFEPQFGIRFLQVMIWGIAVLLLLTGMLCVVVMERQWTIYIDRRPISCGALLLNLLGFRGFYQEWCQIFSSIGGIDWGSTCQVFGI